jgi:pilus assembly protein CpaE
MRELRCLLVGAGAATRSLAATVDGGPGMALAGVVDAAAAVSGLRPACDVIVICDGPGRPAVELASLLARHAAGAPVVVAAAQPDLAVHRAAMAAGARGLVALPADPDELLGAVRAAAAGRAEGGGEAAGITVAVCSGKGGVGASTVALALAEAVGNGLLVDLAGGFDDAAARLGCDGARGIGDLAGLDDALGADALRAVLATRPDGLRLLARPAVGGLAAPALCRAVVRASRAVAPVVALDLGLLPSSPAAAVAVGCDRVLLVTTPDRDAVACAARAAAWLDAEGVPAAGLGLVVNRWRRGGELSLRGIERAGGLPVAAVVRDGRAGRAASELLRTIGAG